MKRLALFAASCVIAIPAYAQNVATVNGKAITQKQFDAFVSFIIEQGGQDSPQLREQVKQEMIGRLVAVQAAEKAGVDKQAAVTQELELARQGILVRALMADYLKKNPVTDADIQAEYNEIKKAQEGRQEYKLRHILVEQEQAAKDLITAIKGKKTTFQAAAEKDSIDSGSGSKGGDLGWGPASNYVPEFAQAVESLKKGEMTQTPIQTQFGWHIIQVDDSRPVSMPSLDEVKPQLEEMLRQDKLVQYQRSLMDSADIK